MMKDKNLAGGKPFGNNAAMAFFCLALVVGMGGLAYASVPLYKLFCQITGYGGTTKIAKAAPDMVVSSRDVTVRFDANVENGFAWEFKPVQREVSIRLGEQKQVAYMATNISDKPLTGTASFNVTPQSAGAYFNKMECFCFTEQTLQPGESIEMPVVFFVDPEIADEQETRNITSITLSYTFYETAPELKPAARLDTATPVKISQDKL